MIVGIKQWPGKKIKLEEEAISEILVADTDSESGAKASDVEDYFEGEEEQQQQQASEEVTITNTSQRNHQPNCAAICVLLAAKERAQCARCDMGLCVVPCFTEYHTVNL
jgi:hypothetical protein